MLTVRDRPETGGTPNRRLATLHGSRAVRAFATPSRTGGAVRTNDSVAPALAVSVEPSGVEGQFYDRCVDPLELRFIVYRHFVETGTAPSRHTLASEVGDLESVDDLLRQLHDLHMLVLDDRPDRSGEIRMALPFAAEPTDFRVTTDQGRWWANCAWDSLAVLAALHRDGQIESTWSDDGEPVDLRIVEGQLDDSEGYIHFAVPARHWWDDIVLT